MSPQPSSEPSSGASPPTIGASPPPVGASPKAIGVHYDVSDEFFRLWLGPEMVYSCAMFDPSREPEAHDLAPAQLRKLDHHIAAAGAAGKKRVLDIGCGWGALPDRLVAHAGVGRAVGLTISPAQARWARERARPGVEIREESWRDHRPEAPYDAIISIGAFEHFVHPGLEGAEKLERYRDFFAWCHGALAPRGRLSLQTIAYVAPPSATERSRMTFIGDKIFPESELPLIWEPAAASEGRFELVALRNDREDYYQTLRLWEANLLAVREHALALVDEATFAAFQRYLRLSSWGFKFGVICLLRMSFVRIG